MKSVFDMDDVEINIGRCSRGGKSHGPRFKLLLPPENWEGRPRLPTFSIAKVANTGEILTTRTCTAHHMEVVITCHWCIGRNLVATNVTSSQQNYPSTICPFDKMVDLQCRDIFRPSSQTVVNPKHHYCISENSSTWRNGCVVWTKKGVAS
jgi:hypothetical protein